MSNIYPCMTNMVRGPYIAASEGEALCRRRRLCRSLRQALDKKELAGLVRQGQTDRAGTHMDALTLIDRVVCTCS